jgi:hypothetical protein
MRSLELYHRIGSSCICLLVLTTNEPLALRRPSSCLHRLLPYTSIINTCTTDKSTAPRHRRAQQSTQEHSYQPNTPNQSILQPSTAVTRAQNRAQHSTAQHIEAFHTTERRGAWHLRARTFQRIASQSNTFRAALGERTRAQDSIPEHTAKNTTVLSPHSTSKQSTRHVSTRAPMSMQSQGENIIAHQSREHRAHYLKMLVS